MSGKIETENGITNYTSYPKSRKYAFFGHERYDITKSEGVVTKDAREFADKREMRLFIRAFKRVARRKHAKRVTVTKPTVDNPRLQLHSTVSVTIYEVKRELEGMRR